MPPIAELEATLLATDPEFFAKQGPLPPEWNESRRFPRFYFRSRVNAIVMPPHHGFEPVERTLLAGDISRGGLSLIHSEQLYPAQRLLLDLHGKTCEVTVCWCRRVRKETYIAGCAFVGLPPPE